MGARKDGMPRELLAQARTFERWRATRTQRAIPEALWASAVELALVHGVHRTSRALRLNYERLRARTAERTRRGDVPESPASFVEVVPPEARSSTGVPQDGECVIELENARGDRARVRTRGVPDLGALVASLWGGGSR